MTRHVSDLLIDCKIHGLAPTQEVASTTRRLNFLNDSIQHSVALSSIGDVGTTSDER